MHKDQAVIMPSAISLTIKRENVEKSIITATAKTSKVNTKFAALNYKKDSVADNYNQLTVTCTRNYGVIFRAYNDGVAYRFFTTMKDSINIQSEEANFNFADDNTAYISFVNDQHNNDIYECSIENGYKHIKLSEFEKNMLAFAPVLIDLPNGKKAAITEADLEEYPGMFLQGGAGNNLHGKFAPYVLEEKQGDHNDLQAFATKRQIILQQQKAHAVFPGALLLSVRMIKIY